MIALASEITVREKDGGEVTTKNRDIRWKCAAKKIGIKNNDVFDGSIGIVILRLSTMLNVFWNKANNKLCWSFWEPTSTG